MIISLSWLSEYVDLPEDVGVLADRLTLAGLEVERITRRGAVFQGVVVAEVTGLRPHPNADKLQLATVTTGRTPVELVTGATNLNLGDRVPLAMMGARLKDRQIGAQVFRGVRSEGMLCSEVELELGDDAGGIMILDRSVPLGADVSTLYPPDTLLHVDVKSNRPDLLCHLGVAREIAALFEATLRQPAVAGWSGPSSDLVTIEAADGCRRFNARLFTDVRVSPSPGWMQARLRAAGVRPISNVVDITNYVMLETGQPMHAFDADRLAAAHLIVRRARPGENLACLDGKIRALQPEFLVVADSRAPQALAGIIGGSQSAVGEGTTRVLLEAATWEPRRIRSTSRAIGLRTEASSRFEKGLSPALGLAAVDRAAALLGELAGGVQRAGADVVTRALSQPAIDLTGERLVRTLGAPISIQEAAGILTRLEFSVEKTATGLRATPPAFRLDCAIVEDLVEEVGRIYGYDRVPSTLAGARRPVSDFHEPLEVDERVRDLLAGCGFDEAVTYTLVDPTVALEPRLPGSPDSLIRIQNPMQEQRDGLRVSLLPGLLQALAHNDRVDQPGVRLFEIGAGFWTGSPDAVPEEPRLLALAVHVARDDQAAAALQVRSVQAALRLVGERIGRHPVAFRQASRAGLHPGRAAEILHGEDPVGAIGELHPGLLHRIGLPGRAVVAEVLLDRLTGSGLQIPLAAPVPRLPGVRRDLTVIIPARVAAAEVAQVIRGLGGYALREISMQSEYEGPQLGTGTRSLSFRLLYMQDDRTMTSDEVTTVQQGIVRGLTARFGAEVRE